MLSVFSKISHLFGIGEDLQKTPLEHQEHIEAMKSLRSLPKDDAEKMAEIEVYKHLYDCLSIIDTKSAALFTANSVLAAVYAIFYDPSTMSSRIVFGIDANTFLGIGLTTMLLSCLLAVFTVLIHWSKTKELQDQERYPIRLLKIRNERTKLYRWSLLLTFAAILMLLIYVVAWRFLV